MEKWSLLKKALSGKREEDNLSSIHRHNGFKIIPKKPIVWIWNIDIYFNNYSSSSIYNNNENNNENNEEKDYFNEMWEIFVNKCYEMMIKYDNSQLYVNLILEESYSDLFMRIIHNVSISGLGSLRTMYTKVSQFPTNQKGTTIAELYIYNKDFKPKIPVCKFYQWTLPNSNLSNNDNTSQVVIYTRERLPDAGVAPSDLFSHRLHGIDNTGNIKVWDAEAVFTYILLTESEYFEDFSNKRVLELGGGSTGLCSLGLASSPNHSCREIVVTDGHPDCVFNQNICLEMCRQSKSIPNNFKISSHQLRWKHSDPDNELNHILTLNIGDNHFVHDKIELNQQLLSNSSPINESTLILPPPQPPTHNYSDQYSNKQLFDRIIACDCMFFKEYHTDLVWILFNSLTSNGIIYMFQPRRGNTMELFLNHARQYFEITIKENYNQKITELHEQFLQNSTVYDPDIHYPLLVILKKLGVENEYETKLSNSVR